MLFFRLLISLNTCCLHQSITKIAKTSWLDTHLSLYEGVHTNKQTNIILFFENICTFLNFNYGFSTCRLDYSITKIAITMGSTTSWLAGPTENMGTLGFCSFLLLNFLQIRGGTGPFILQPLFQKSVEKWFEKSGLRNLVREIWFEKSG